MVSGKYSALAGAVSREQQMANISANLANVNTIGYKKNRISFESILRGEQQTGDAKGINYNRIRNNYTEFSEGALKTTGNPLDLAIHGDGFFKVLSQDGMKFTRRGDLHLNEQGILQTGSNMPVMDENNQPIYVPDSDVGKVSINSFGEISMLTMDGMRNIVGKVGVFTINDNKLLNRDTDTLFSLQDGATATVVEEPDLAVSSLEVSNVNMTQEMALMISTLRTFESYKKVIKSYSALGEKQSELGTLG
jgi:flagellar basal-body rod protein FlgF/flagellar basal-body rod protein FlgG